ncbi:MAG: DUF72 domain-containing protein [Thermoplasmata archaeon]|nr:DUF72 domain-containing protein [Thermoplasmata archaeon]
MPRYRVGTAGWAYDDWKGVFYPTGAAPGEYLSRYSRVFDVTEVDSSFYRAPSPFLARRWATTTPPGFRFTLKIPQDVTHPKAGGNPQEALREFLSNIEPIRAAGKLGPIVAQFPPSFSREKGEGRLAELLRDIPEEYQLAVELRHGSWWDPRTYELLRERQAALVWSVLPFVHVPPERTGPFVYVRFIGDRALTTFDRIQRDYRPQISEMRDRIEGRTDADTDVYAIMNNHFMGFGPGSAQIVREVFDLPPLDLSAAAREAGQLALGDFPADPKGPAPDG